MHVRWLWLAIPVMSALGACSAMPTNGPSSGDVRAAVAGPNSLPYAVVNVSPDVVATLARTTPRLSTAFNDKRPPSRIVFGKGDIVSVTIFEAAAGGLFIPAEASVRPGNFIQLPNQAVDSNGNISVPYAGFVRAQGRTQPEVQETIVNALKARALQPQVVVALVDQRTSLINVIGDVNNPSRVPATPDGERVVDVITRAGGPKSQGFDEWVMLERGGRREIIPFGALVYEPSNNIYIRPGDTIYMYREPQTFVAFGAFVSGSTTQAQINFDAWRLTLAQAMAKAGGLNDLQADPASVFLYRGETREVAVQLGVDVSRFTGPIIPIVFAIDFRDPSAFFLAQQIQMRRDDVIYASNAPAVESAKVLNFIRLVTATVNDPIVAATDAYALKAAVNGATPITNVVTTTPAITTAQ